MPLVVGARLGAYEILAAIGAGGMGEVYRARDTKLNRDVALKVLPEVFAHDPDRIARFQREAQVLASLMHPNIGVIHGFEDATDGDGTRIQALVLELVEGPTLEEELRKSEVSSLKSEVASGFSRTTGMALDEALPIARQIADALESAHEQGVVHRDLKPANIKVKPDGTVKVLDFGLAKLLDPTEPTRSAAGVPGAGAGLAGLSQSPTMTTPAMTGVGVILGTAAYMSPEQAKGRAADKRSDIWAFGCVLFQMLSGTRPFAGDDVADVLAAVLRAEPDWNALPASTPASIRHALRLCLEKDPKRRLRDIGDIRIFLDGPAEPQIATSPQLGSAVSGRASLMWALGGLLVGASVVFAGLYTRRPSIDPQATRFTVLAPQNVALSNTSGQTVPSVSPDGRLIAFVALRNGTPLLWTRPLDSLEATPLAGTEFAMYPFWSPDSRTMGFFSQGKLKTVSSAGGVVQVVCDAPNNRGGTWSRRGLIVFADTAHGLFTVPATGGEATALTTTDQAHGESGHWFPFFLPDGQHYLYRAFPSNDIRLGSLDSKETTRLLNVESQVEFARPGYLLFGRQGTVFAQAFDPDRGTLSGSALPLVEQVASDAANVSLFTVSDGGTLVYRSGALLETTQLTWVDRAGKVLGVVGPRGMLRNPSLSPDGSRVAVEAVDSTSRNRDIWVLNLASGVFSQLTFDPHDDIFPIWSPDSRFIAFGSDRDGSPGIYRKPSDGSAKEELLFKSTTESAAPTDWTSDGRFLVHRYVKNGSFNFGILPLSGDRKPRLYQQVSYTQGSSRASPNGRSIAYQTTETGRFEVFVGTFPTAGGEWHVSNDGGVSPRWSADDKELFYYAASGVLMAVPVSGDAVPQLGAATSLFKANLPNGPTSAVGFLPQYDVSRDGKRFLLNVPVDEKQTSSIDVVLNWPSALRGSR